MVPTPLKKENAAAFFGRLVQLEENEFWRAVFQRACEGKLPRKCNLSRDGKVMYLTSAKGGGVQQQILLQGEPDDMLVKLKDVFRRHSRLVSPEDTDSNKNRLKSSKVNAEKQSWKTWKLILKNKDVVHFVLMDYTRRLSTVYDMTIDEQSMVYNSLSVAVSLGQISESDVILIANDDESYEGSNSSGVPFIKRIKNFKWDNVQRKVHVKYGNEKKTVAVSSNKKQSGSISVLWSEYCNGGCKRKRKVVI